MAPSAALVAIWVLYLVDFLSMFAITAYSRTPPTLRPWLDAPFTMADSVIDLAAVALARGVVLCVLVLALRLRVRSPTPCAPTAGLASLAEPLLDPVADEAGASNGAPATAGDETPAAVRARKVTFRVLLVSRVWLAAQASYVLAKCLARLTLGPPADVALRSVEGLFWAVLYFEHTSLSYQVHPAPVAGAPAKPRQTRVRDAFFGLAIAAVGESLIPYLYGEILNEIALSKDPNAFRKPMLQLLLTAAATGTFLQ
ncbi:hypothetical protein T492DRAFT_873304 [Pavlovales sp. CCMP2436]|nr:hypothetical protein T492DRAFT_873304 [Pavlovales sp. CCMP2436]